MAGHYTGSYLDRSNGWRAVATLAPQHLRSPEQVCAGQTADGARESLFCANDHYPNVRASSHIARRLVWARLRLIGLVASFCQRSHPTEFGR